MTKEEKDKFIRIRELEIETFEQECILRRAEADVKRAEADRDLEKVRVEKAKLYLEIEQSEQ